MALIERLMHHSSEDQSRFISVHEFFAAITEMMAGQLTAEQIQNYYQMTAADIIDWNAIAATMPAQNQTASRAVFMHRIHSIFILAEHRVTLYSTPNEVRARLGI